MGEKKSRAKRNKARAKVHERKIAQFIKQFDPDARAIGTLSAEDVVSRFFILECKTRVKLPKWILEAFDQTREEQNPGKIPVVVIHLVGSNYLNDYVMIKLKDFLKLVEVYYKHHAS